jgi:hypothetical protein
MRMTPSVSFWSADFGIVASVSRYGTVVVGPIEGCGSFTCERKRFRLGERTQATFSASALRGLPATSDQNSCTLSSLPELVATYACLYEVMNEQIAETRIISFAERPS